MGQWYEDDPSRAEAKAQGVALVLQGTHSIREAAQSVGLSSSALQRAVVKLEEGTALDPELRRADQAVMAKTYQLADQAQQRVLNRLPFMEDKDVVNAMKASVLGISAWRRWQKPEVDPEDLHASNRILSRLDAVLQAGGEMVVTVAVAGPRGAAGSDDPL